MVPGIVWNSDVHKLVKNSQINAINVILLPESYYVKHKVQSYSQTCILYSITQLY